MELMQRRRELMTFEHGHWATATGSIATFNTPFAKPLRSLKAEFMPVQEGTGDPSPDNVRPITGWTGLMAYRAGQNIWDEQWEQGSYNASTGKPNDNYNSNIRSKATSPIPVKPNTSYCVYIGKAINVRCLFYTEKDEFISAPTSVRNSVITSPPNARLMRFYVGTGYGGTYENNIAINYPATATTYAPYSGTTIPVDWTTEAGTVYSGTLDVTSGELVVNTVAVPITPDTISTRSERGYACVVVGTLGYVNADIPQICNVLPTVASASSVKNGAFIVYNSSGYNRAHIAFCFPDCYGANAAETRSLNIAKVTELIESGTTPIVVFGISEPQTYHLTPQQIPTLIGTNNIWSSANGNVTAEYWTR